MGGGFGAGFGALGRGCWVGSWRFEGWRFEGWRVGWNYWGIGCGTRVYEVQ